MAIDHGNCTITVTKDDTLYSIAQKYYKTYGYSDYKTYMNYLVEINNISNPDNIFEGYKYILTKSASSNVPSKPASKASTRVSVKRFGLITSNSDTLSVTWDWAQHNNTEKYIVRWYYSWDNRGEARSDDHEVTHMWDNYTPESYVIESDNGKVSVAIKPVSKTYKVTKNGKEVDQTYFSGEFTTITDDVRYYYGKRAPNETPSPPSVEIKDTTLTATRDGVPDDYQWINFEICKITGKEVDASWKSGMRTVQAGKATLTLPIELGSTYKVRCMYVNNNGRGPWSEWSEECGTEPSAPSGITICRAITKTEVYLAWEASPNAESYDIEYATKIDYFDNSSDVRSIHDIEGTQYFVTNLDSGDEYFFRVRAVNEYGESGWTAPTSIIIGTKPAPPRTWSSTTTVISGEELTFYWAHNSEDESTQTKAEIEMTINGRTTTETIYTPDIEGDDNDDKRMYYTLPTTGFVEGATILWRVRTAGATGEYGDWSIQRTVTVYAQPVLAISVPELLTSFPLTITGSAGPNTQKPVAYHISVISNSYYETSDELGDDRIIAIGDEIYSKFIDTSEALNTSLSASDLDLSNNASYIVKVIVSMNSGLTAEDSRSFTVAWSDDIYEPNAEMGYDSDTYTMLIRPYCKDKEGNLLEDVTLSVYRREYNGKFTEIISGIDNALQTYITDPHPALDYARYRIVARSNATGAISYVDLPAYYIGESAIIIQWDDDWHTFTDTDELATAPAWSGSLLRLPYNIDVSEDFNVDVSMVEYVGREHPVSYFGTQRGESATWNVEIPKSDKETLYGIRRLATWMGNVYVREPSGTGYWARVKLSFSQRHRNLVIPITLSITRVEGGA